MFQTPTYQKIIRVTRYVLLLLLSGFVFYKLFYAYKINELYHQFSSKDHTGSFEFLIAALLLMGLNWTLEALKWFKLIRNYESIDFSTSVKAVLSGITLGIITPNQLGDFAGRVLHLRILNKIKGSLVTVVGHTAQVLVTLFFGVFALGYFSSTAFGNVNWIPFGVAFVVVLLLGYLNLKQIYTRIKGTRFIRKFESNLAVFGDFSPSALAMILGLSALRYLVYMFQYYLLLRFFRVEIDLIPALASIIGAFCVQSVVPSFLLLEIGLRGASALWFFSLYSQHTEGILLAAYSLWIINILLPAVPGMYYIYRIKE